MVGATRIRLDTIVQLEWRSYSEYDRQQTPDNWWYIRVICQQKGAGTDITYMIRISRAVDRVRARQT